MTLDFVFIRAMYMFSLPEGMEPSEICLEITNDEGPENPLMLV